MHRTRSITRSRALAHHCCSVFHVELAYVCTVPCLSYTATEQPTAALVLFTMLQELASFMRVQSAMQLVVDSSPQNELLKITFNIR